ncbi:MAG TPA: hypothetical protein DCO89_01560 [Clostridiales bacterium]|nr:hypothetical protein [Clostridiales bacterium]
MKNIVKSDLILEASKGLKTGDGFYREVKKLSHGIKQTNVKILDKKTAKRIGREVGNYISFTFDDLLYYDLNSKKFLSKIIKFAIKTILKENNLSPKKILVVGLGNEKYACDSLGKKVVDKVLITKPFLERDLFSSRKMAEIYAISLGVYGTTGLESSETTKSICKMLKPDLVIAIDSLVASDVKTLSLSVQISDTKLSPGGGVGNNRKEISEELLDVKVLAVGVPLVVKFNGNNNFIVTIKDVEEKVEQLSKIISNAINLCFCHLTEKEYLELTN